MASCASPSSNGEVRDGVIVGLEDLGVVEDFVPKRVQSVQGHSDVGGRHPVLRRHNGTTSADGRDAVNTGEKSCAVLWETLRNVLAIRQLQLHRTPALYPTANLTEGSWETQ